MGNRSVQILWDASLKVLFLRVAPGQGRDALCVLKRRQAMDLHDAVYWQGQRVSLHTQRYARRLHASPRKLPTPCSFRGVSLGPILDDGDSVIFQREVVPRQPSSDCCSGYTMSCYFSCSDLSPGRLIMFMVRKKRGHSYVISRATVIRVNPSQG